MTSTAPVPTSGWKITGQRQTQQLPPGSQNFVQGYDVTFVTGNQVTATVFVPATQYTPAGVSAAVNERAAQLDAVHNLSAPPAS